MDYQFGLKQEVIAPGVFKYSAFKGYAESQMRKLRTQTCYKTKWHEANNVC